MKKIFLSLLFSLIYLNAQSFVHPLDFQGTSEDKKCVVEYITKNVKATYSQVGMGDPSTLRMMEKQELESFKALTKVSNRKLLDNIIEQYCAIGMCNYNTIEMMYNQQYKDAQSKLEW